MNTVITLSDKLSPIAKTLFEKREKELIDELDEVRQILKQLDPASHAYIQLESKGEQPEKQPTLKPASVSQDIYSAYPKNGTLVEKALHITAKTGALSIYDIADKIKEYEQDDKLDAVALRKNLSGVFGVDNKKYGKLKREKNDKDIYVYSPAIMPVND